MKNLDYFRTALPPDELYTVEEILSVPAGDILENEFTVQKGRGDIQAYSFAAASDGATSNELMLANITLSPNGKSSTKKANLLRFSEKFRLEKTIIYPQCIKAGSTMGFKIDNTGNANDLVVTIIQYFYYPLQQLETHQHKPNC